MVDRYIILVFKARVNGLRSSVQNDGYMRIFRLPIFAAVCANRDKNGVFAEGDGVGSVVAVSEAAVN